MVLLLLSVVGLVVWAVLDFRRKGRFLARKDGMVEPERK